MRRLGHNAQRVLEYVVENPSCHPNAMSEPLDLDYSTVYHVLMSLEWRGLVARQPSMLPGVKTTWQATSKADELVVR